MTPIVTRAAAELAHLPVLIIALETLDDLLLAEHPTLLEFAPYTTSTLREAAKVRCAIARLRARLGRYQRAVELAVGCDDLPY